MLATDLAVGLDGCRLFRRTVGADPDPWQARLLRSTAPRVLLNCHRQSGKSTATGVIAAHTAVYEPGALVLVLSPSLRQSGELFRKIQDALHALDAGPPVEAESALRVELSNGSRIVSLPGNESTVRGFSGVRLLVVDEAARVDDGLVAAVRPMLATSGGRLIMLSTPFGQRGAFYEAWANGGDTWQRFEVPVTENPRISPEFIEEERAALIPWIFSQEYLCQFEANEAALFDRTTIDGAFDPAIETLFGGSEDAGQRLFVRAGPGAE